MYIPLRPLPIRSISPSTSNNAPGSLHSAVESYRSRCLSCPHKDYLAACTPTACHTDSPIATATATAIRIHYSRDHGPCSTNSSHTPSPISDAVAPSCLIVALLLPPRRRSHQDPRHQLRKHPAPVCFDFWRQNSRAQTPRLQPRLALPSASVSAACRGRLGFPTAAAYPRVPMVVMVVMMAVMIDGGDRHSCAVCAFPRAPGSSCPLPLGPGCSAAARVRLQTRSVVGVASPLLVVRRVAWRLKDSALDRRWWSDPDEPLLGTTHVHRQGE